MLEEDKNITDKLFHDTLAEWEAQPSPTIWDKVEAMLDEDKRRPAAWWWVAGLILLLTGVVATWYFWPKPIVPKQYSALKVKTQDSLTIIGDSLLEVNHLMFQAMLDSNMKGLQQQVDSINNNTTASSLSKTNSIPTKPTFTINTSPIITKTPAIRTSTLSPTANVINTTATKKSITPNNTSASKIISTGKDSTITKSTRPIATETKEPKKAQPAIQNESITTANKEPTQKIAESITEKTQTPITLANTNNTNTSVAKSQPTDSIVPPKPSNSMADKLDSINAIVKKLQQQKIDSVKNDSIAQKTKKDSAINKQANATQPKDSTKPAMLPDLFSISIYFAPEIAKNDVTANNSKFNVQNAKPAIKYSAGVKFSINLSSKFEVNIGLSYSEYSQSLSPDTVTFSRSITQPFIFNTSLGDLSVPAATMLQGFYPAPWITQLRMHYQYTETVKFINMPINARVNFGVGKLKTYVTAGVNLQYTAGSNATLTLLKENETDQLSYTNLSAGKFNIAASIGIGAEYKLVKHLSVFVEPNTRMNMLPISNSNKSLNYFIGCQGGLKLEL